MVQIIKKSRKCVVCYLRYYFRSPKFKNEIGGVQTVSICLKYALNWLLLQLLCENTLSRQNSIIQELWIISKIWKMKRSPIWYKN